MLAGCQLPPPTPDTPPQPVTINCDVPTFTPLAGTTDSEEQGGIRIFVTPGPYSCVPSSKTTRAAVDPSLGDYITRPPATNPQQPPVFVEDTQTPTLLAAPDRLVFSITIKNNLPRVFRGSGTVVMYNIGGKNQNVDQSNFSELNNLIVPPQTEAQVTIYGPPLAQIDPQQKLALYLYDVVTKTDAAGNVTQKQNFEWDYKYTLTAKTQQGMVTKSRHWILG